MRKIRMPFIAIITLVVLTTIVLAPFLVSGAGYLINVLVVESNSTSYTNLPIIAVINNSYLSANGYMTSTGLDTRIINAANTTLKHMVADNKTLFVDNITASSTANFEYKSGYSALDSFPIIVGNGGSFITVDNDTMELVDNFILTISAYINTASGSDKNLVVKPDGSDYAFKVYISNTSEITAGVDNGTVVAVATGVNSGEHIVKVMADGTDLKIYIDDVLEDSSALGATNVTDTSDDWIWNQNNVMPYINSINLYKIEGAAPLLPYLEDQRSVGQTQMTGNAKYADVFLGLPAGTVNSISFLFAKTGAPTGTITVYVKKASADDNNYEGSLGTVDVSTFTSTPTWYTFGNSTYLDQETDYTFWVEWDGANVFNYPTLGVYAPNDHANIYAADSLIEGNWINDYNKIYSFILYYTPD